MKNLPDRLLRLEDQNNEIRLFVSQKLYEQLDKMRSKLLLDGQEYVSGDGFYKLTNGASFELEYAITIDEMPGFPVRKIGFDILVHYDGYCIVELLASGKIIDFKDIRAVDLDDVVRAFIPDMDVLQVLET